MTLLIGGLLIIAALVVGHFEGYLMGVKVKNVGALIAGNPVEPDVPRDPDTCLCGHYRTTHRQPFGCRVHAGYSDHGDAMTCSCSGFIGKPIAQPKGALEL